MKQIKLVFAALCLISPMAANADIIIDQENPTVGGGFCYINYGARCGQSFQQDGDNIAGAGIHLNPYWETTGTVTISIWEQYVGGLTGLVATGTSDIVGTGWVDVFWNTVAVNPLTTYYMVVSSSSYFVASYDGGSYQNGLYGSGGALYNGTVYSNNYDLTFRTYVDDKVSVPEPGTLALLGLGLVGMAARRRKTV